MLTAGRYSAYNKTYMKYNGTNHFSSVCKPKEKNVNFVEEEKILVVYLFTNC